MLLLLGFLALLVLIKVIQKLTLGKDDSNICLVGKTAIVTGGHRGIGFETVLKLAARGCKVIIADVLDSEKSVKEAIELTNNGNISWKYIDLASFESVRKFADEIYKSEERLDILINNAGVCGFEGVYTADGILKAHQINYFSPFLLTHLLVGLLKKTPGSRIVFVSSILFFLHNVSTIKTINKPAVLKYISFFQLLTDYGNNKLYVMISAQKIAEKLKKHGITCVSVHPGIVWSTIFDATKRNSIAKTFLNIGIFFLSILMALYAKTTSEGAETSFYCAVSPKVKRSTGGFYSDCGKFYLVPLLARNAQFCEDLWKESEKMARLEPNEKLD